MIIYLVRDLRGSILGAYDNERAARTHLEALVRRFVRAEWRDYVLWVNDRYAGRVESVDVKAAYEKERER